MQYNHRQYTISQQDNDATHSTMQSPDCVPCMNSWLAGLGNQFISLNWKERGKFFPKVQSTGGRGSCWYYHTYLGLQCAGENQETAPD